MKKIFVIFILSISILGCKSKAKENPIVNTETNTASEVVATEAIHSAIEENEIIDEKTVAQIVKEEVKTEKVALETDLERQIEKPVVVKPVIQNDIDHSQWNTLLQKNVSANGNVNYKNFVKDKAALQSYLSLLEKQVPTNAWTKNAKLAYWINVYNAYTVKLIVDNYPTKSIKNISNPWGKKFFTLAGTKYSLEDVEHKILRKMDEPRIHFAINCASFSCPNLSNKAYVAATLNIQLETAAKVFVNDATKNVLGTNEIKISEIFNWFEADFKTKNTTVIDYINKYAKTKVAKNAKIKHLDYNWDLND